jgi:hypothetical protein
LSAHKIGIKLKKPKYQIQKKRISLMDDAVWDYKIEA